MCTTCGCGETHLHHDHETGHSHENTIRLEADILGANDRFAAFNRGYFAGKEIKAFNLVSSPGSGKTTLLEATVKALRERETIYVIEGDQETENDANRIKALGVTAVQINTKNGCHLDAHMVGHAVEHLQPANKSLLFIENVGNLVCPAMFDLGEAARVVVVSVTEGDDKSLKYPYMFEGSQVCVINKIDLLPYIDSEIERLKANVLRINPSMKFFEISATQGIGLKPWLEWLCEEHTNPGHSHPHP